MKRRANDRQLVDTRDTCGEIDAERRIDRTIAIDFSYRRDRIPRIIATCRRRRRRRRRQAASKLELRCRNFSVVPVVVGIGSADRRIDDPCGTLNRNCRIESTSCRKRRRMRLLYKLLRNGFFFFMTETIFFGALAPSRNIRVNIGHAFSTHIPLIVACEFIDSNASFQTANARDKH